MARLLQLHNKPASWFAKVILLAIAVFSIACLCSCVTQKQRDRICKTCTLKETVKDSTGVPEVTNTYFDSTLWIAKHKGKDQEFANCDSIYAMLSRHSNTLTTIDNGVRSTITGVGKRLVFKCETDSLKEVIKLLKQKVNTPHFKTITREVPARCEKEHKTSFDGFTNWFFYIVGGFILLLTGVKFLTGKIPFLSLLRKQSDQR